MTPGKEKRNTDIDWIRAILIILMILIHIVSFGNAYPQLKAGPVIHDAYLPHYHRLSCEYREDRKTDEKLSEMSRLALRHHGDRILGSLLFHAGERWHHGTLPLSDL